MNAESQIWKSELASRAKKGAAAEFRDEIGSVEIDVEDAAHRTTSFGARVNDIPFSRKFRLYHATLIMLFGITLAASALPMLGEHWTRITVLVDGIVGLAGIAWIMLASRAMNRDLITPLEHNVQELRRLADGERDLKLRGVERGDEIGKLARTTQFLAKAGVKMDELYLIRKRADAERARAEAQRQSELLDIATQFETTVGQIAGNVATAAAQLKATAMAMTESAHGSSEKARSVVEAMNQASNSVAAAAAASDEFAMSIAEISRQATQSEELARKASSVAEGTDKTISALADSASQVNQIVELIQSIAGRTNILALNASIEAARGGEAGRGFAVVASEVKELAAKTSSATEDVGSQIEAMQQSTQLGVTKLREIGERVSQLETTSIAIASAVDQQSVAGKDLAQSIDRSAQGTEQVSSHAEELLDQATAVGAAADQLLASAQDLEGQASALTVHAHEFLGCIRAA